MNEEQDEGPEEEVANSNEDEVQQEGGDESFEQQNGADFDMEVDETETSADSDVNFEVFTL
jgi:hypothetical protein